MGRFVDQDVDPFPDRDDAYRVSKEDDDLRGSLVLGPEGQELVYEPIPRLEPRGLRGRALHKNDRVCADCGEPFFASGRQIRCKHCRVVDDLA